MNNSMRHKEYFAGNNNGTGFTNFLPDLIEEMEKVFIIKGTPGCGKSTFMKRVADKLESNGFDYELIRCSSDVNSLDGVICRSLSFAVVDGTAPHIMDVDSSNARDSELDFGSFINKSTVESARESIDKCVSEKARCYNELRLILAAKNELYDLRNTLTEAYFNYGKAKAFVYSEIAKAGKPTGTASMPVRRAAFAFCSGGTTMLNSFPDVSTAVLIPDGNGAAQRILTLIGNEANLSGLPFIYSPDPFNGKYTAAIYLQSAGILYANASYICEEAFETVKKINISRFIQSDIAASFRCRQSFAAKTEKELVKEASALAEEAYMHHLDLEKYYTNAVNFSALNEFEQNFYNVIKINKSEA